VTRAVTPLVLLAESDALMCTCLRMVLCDQRCVRSKRDDENHKIPALDAGATYLTRPFGTGELLARARLRRRQRATASSLGTALKVGPTTTPS
jgi:DNA-binding response OmpR family regulator